MKDTTPNERVTRWLGDLDRVLAGDDPVAVTALFDEACFWRDMVAFTWNIKTMEGKAEIAAMLRATAPRVRPRSFEIEGEAREADGVTEARFTFETTVAPRPRLSAPRGETSAGPF